LIKSRLSAVLVNNLVNGKTVDWNNWTNREILNYCDLYIESKWCNVYKMRVDQIQEYQQAVHKVESRKIDILNSIIDKTKGLKKYMMIHSIFNIDAKSKGDWFVKYLVNKLQPAQWQVDIVHKKKEIPTDIMELFKKFNPKPISDYDEVLDNTKIYYKLYGNRFKGEQSDPILVIDRSWEKLDRPIPIEEVEESISSFEEIEC